MRTYNPRVGRGPGGFVNKEDFSIDGKSWAYRDPDNYDRRRTFQRDGDEGNQNAYDFTNPLYDYSYGQARDAAEALGIGNVNKQEEVDQLLSYMKGDRPTNDADNEISEPEPEPEPLAPSTPENVEYSPRAARAKTFPGMYEEALLNDRLNPMRDDYNDAAQNFLSDYTNKLLQLGSQATSA